MFVEKTQDLKFETLLENLYVSWCHFETGRGWGGDGRMSSDIEPRAFARLPALAATLLFQNTVNIKGEGLFHLISLPIGLFVGCFPFKVPVG